MREIYEAPELNLISYVPLEKLASSIGFGDMSVGIGGSNGKDSISMGGDKAPIESTDISFDF